MVARTITCSRNGLLALAIFQIISAGGLLFGWSSLQPILISEGFLAEPCLPSGGKNGTVPPSVEELKKAAGCDKQAQALGNVFSVAINVRSASQLLVGYLLDKHGPKNALVLSFLVTTIGLVLLGCRQLWVAVIMLAVGTPGIQNSLFHVANLFPFASGFATSVINGSVSFSMGIFTVFSLVYASGKGASLLSICIAYAGLTFLMTLTSAVVWPDKNFTQFFPRKMALSAPVSRGGTMHGSRSSEDLPALAEKLLMSSGSDQKQRKQEPTPAGLGGSRTIRGASMRGAGKLQHKKRSTLSSIVESWITVSLPSVNEGKDGVVNAQDTNAFYRLPLRKQMMTSHFALFVAFFSVQLTLANYYLATAGEQVQAIECSKHGADSCSAGSLKKASTFTFIFNTALVVGGTFTPVVGWVIDRFGLPACGFLSCFLSLVYSLTLFVVDTDLQIISFVAYVLWRCALFTFVFAYLAHKFGFANFGMLVAVAYLLCGAVGFLMVPLIELASPKKPYSTSCDSSMSCWMSLGYRLPNFIQTVLLAVSLLFPFVVASRKNVAAGVEDGDRGKPYAIKKHTAQDPERQALNPAGAHSDGGFPPAAILNVPRAFGDESAVRSERQGSHPNCQA